MARGLVIPEKSQLLEGTNLLILNRDLDSFSADGWTDGTITKRTGMLIQEVLDVWNVPHGYKSSTVRDVPLATHSVDLSDLLSAGLIVAGQKVFPKALNLREHVGQILPDGRIDTGGHVFRDALRCGIPFAEESHEWVEFLVDRSTNQKITWIHSQRIS